jgi:pyruvate formate lyase activating enzyme
MTSGLHTHANLNKITCDLCPRGCMLGKEGIGWCGVRQENQGAIKSLGYGLAAAIGIETIETEAVFHYAPGERILALGNFGCNLSCDFCQNWRTSQVAHFDWNSASKLTPAGVVDMAKAFGVRMISWTYNEPVVWHEFVLDASRICREAGILTLYKSAFYITERAATELLQVIDIFSISIKSLDPGFYERLTGGRLEPILKAAELVHASGRHLEISNLLIPGENTSPDDIKRMADWVIERLSPDVPLHFVRFHPDFMYTKTTRTPVEMLFRAREIALNRGVKHVYLGNATGA